MFGKFFKVLVAISVLFGITNKQKQNNKKTLNDFDFMDQPSENFSNAVSNPNPQESVSFVPSAEAQPDVNNNFNQNDDATISSPG